VAAHVTPKMRRGGIASLAGAYNFLEFSTVGWTSRQIPENRGATMRDAKDWMWASALDMLARTERLHRQMFQPSASQPSRAAWEPPVDVLETESEVLIIAALPGVASEQVDALIDGGCLIITGERAVPAELRTAAIHRMELPQGRFERRVPLPRGTYDHVTRRMVDGCLLVSLRKTA